jgi:hypothetical protein
VRDIHAPLSGDPQPCIEAPVTAVDIYTTHDTNKEKAHEVAHTTIHLIRSLKPTGFHGSTYGVTLEDPTVGFHIMPVSLIRGKDHMRVGMEEGHEKIREMGEESMNHYLSDLIMVHVAFKKHGA